MKVQFVSLQDNQWKKFPTREKLEQFESKVCAFNKLLIPSGGEMKLEADEMNARLLLLFDSSCLIKFSDDSILVNEVAVFFHHPKDIVMVKASDENLCVLEMIIPMHTDEYKPLVSSGKSLLFKYSESPVYNEDIKSEKTVSRTLLPSSIVPRLSIGSVYTIGEDRVAVHEHPMLEQFFLSLTENESTLIIDDRKYSFPSLSLVNIPTGSKHGVTVNEHHILHYLWIDVFFNQEEMNYLEEHHIPLDHNEL